MYIVPHHHCTHDPKSGLTLIDAKDMSKHMPLGSQLRSIVRLDSLWLASFALGITPGPGWSGFNQLVTESQSQSNVFNVSDIVALPFINLNPSDMSTNTALIFAHKESSLFNRSYCIVTFDKTLFIKAVDIVHANSELCDSVSVRLVSVAKWVAKRRSHTWAQMATSSQGVCRNRCGAQYMQRVAYLR